MGKLVDLLLASMALPVPTQMSMLQLKNLETCPVSRRIKNETFKLKTQCAVCSSNHLVLHSEVTCRLEIPVKVKILVTKSDVSNINLSAMVTQVFQFSNRMRPVSRNDLNSYVIESQNRFRALVSDISICQAHKKSRPKKN